MVFHVTDNKEKKPPLSGTGTDVAALLASTATGAYASKVYLEEKVTRILERAGKAYDTAAQDKTISELLEAERSLKDHMHDTK